MATSTRSTSRARTTTRAGTKGAGAGTGKGTTRKMPAPKFAPERGHGLLSRAWLGLAHIVGGAARVLGKETLAKGERRDGVPFFLVTLAIFGAVVKWFNPTDPVAVALDAYSFGGL
ncbi:MAG: cell division protein FtsK, partial [Microbacteriaceae bacterium]|nr:cell division protein FtsK [Microbacteriaceae bacterium]